ncbi:hypothetical protein ES703_18169 [subsurface metagenome]
MEMDVKKRCDIACEILHQTNDGNDLAPEHLKLLEMAVNGFLNDKGWAAFEDLHRQVKAGYKKPWFHGIEHLSNDHNGYVRWKGNVVEHYTFDNYDEEEESAVELAERCRILESNGIEVTMGNAIWLWEEKYAHLKEGKPC